MPINPNDDMTPRMRPPRPTDEDIDRAVAADWDEGGPGVWVTSEDEPTVAESSAQSALRKIHQLHEFYYKLVMVDELFPSNRMALYHQLTEASWQIFLAQPFASNSPLHRSILRLALRNSQKEVFDKARAECLPAFLAIYNTLSQQADNCIKRLYS